MHSCACIPQQHKGGEPFRLGWRKGILALCDPRPLCQTNPSPKQTPCTKEKRQRRARPALRLRLRATIAIKPIHRACFQVCIYASRASYFEVALNSRLQYVCTTSKVVYVVQCVAVIMHMFCEHIKRLLS